MSDGDRTAVLDLLAEDRDRGAIVNTASISGLGGDYGLSTYNAAKGAVVNYTRAAAIEHAHEIGRALHDESKSIERDALLREHLDEDVSGLELRAALARAQERARTNTARRARGEPLAGLVYALDPATYGA